MAESSTWAGCTQKHPSNRHTDRRSRGEARLWYPAERLLIRDRTSPTRDTDRCQIHRGPNSGTKNVNGTDKSATHPGWTSLRHICHSLYTRHTVRTYWSLRLNATCAYGLRIISAEGQAQKWAQKKLILTEGLAKPYIQKSKSYAQRMLWQNHNTPLSKTYLCRM